MPRAAVKPQKNESHLRYKTAAEEIISRATTEQEKASLETMKVQEFLIERDENGTVSFKPRFPFVINASPYF